MDGQLIARLFLVFLFSSAVRGKTITLYMHFEFELIHHTRCGTIPLMVFFSIWKRKKKKNTMTAMVPQIVIKNDKLFMKNKIIEYKHVGPTT